MTDLQKRFCEEYIVDYNLTKAGERAGIQGDNVGIVAWKMYKLTEVQEYIEELKQIQSQRTFVTADRVQAEIARLAFSDIRDYYHEDGFLKRPDELDDNSAAALAGIEIDEIWGMGMSGEKEKIGETKKIKLYDKLSALDKLAKRLGMFEKDNEQSKPVITLPEIKVYNTAPPLSNNEKDLNV